MSSYLIERGPYFIFAFLMSSGTYLLVSHRNLLKGIVGLSLFQSGIILFFIFLAVRTGGTIPILYSNEVDQPPLDNPLPHALMLTAIVVGVATLGLALAMLRRIYDEKGNIEDRIFEREN